jgi:hypothetical protein
VQERGAIAHDIGSLTSLIWRDGLLGFAGHGVSLDGLGRQIEG